MRVSIVRLGALVAGIAIVVSCDGGPVVGKFGNGIAGGATGTAPVTPPAPGSVDTNRPFVRIDTPVATPVQLINAGDSILVVTRIIDDRKVGNLVVTGYQFKGNASLGTLQQIQRYPSVTAPAGPLPFRPGLVDTIIRRYLMPAVPIDTSVDSLQIWAIHTDSAGNADTTRRTIQLVNGPKVLITAPVANDSVPKGISFTVTAQADHPAGIDTIEIHIFGEPTWPLPRLDTTVRAAYGPSTTTATLTASILVPINAPSRGRITINARARDANRNQGNAPPIVVFARAASSVAPRVYQTVPTKLEYADSITVTATADGVAGIGRILLDSALGVIDSLLVPFVSPFNSNQTVRMPLNLGLSDQGRRISVISFAVDSAGVVGWSLPQGFGIPVTVRGNAFRDTTLITHGRTYALPRIGTAGDIAVDIIRGNTFVSNTSFNLLEVWNNTSKSFAANGVAVGALPWGMFVSNNPDTLLVANSGATTISRVFIGAASAASHAEDLSRRIRTRENVVYSVEWTRDDASGKIKFTRNADVAYSDRPQYVVQSAGSRIFYSTKPTGDATPGTIRWLDPALAVPDPRQIWQYGKFLPGVTATYVIFNVDSILISATPGNSLISDTLFIFDHPYGAAAGSIVVFDSTPAGVIAKAQALGSDIQMVNGLNIGTLALTDTTFVGASGDRNWVGFGEGNTGGSGRLMLVNDPIGPVPGFFSPAITVTDMVHNASEKVFGMAMDSTGLQIMSHGLQTYIAAVDNPFHLRLDGVYDSFDNGAGVAYHPQAKSTLSANANRVGFSATSGGVIEIIDVAHYNQRGRLITKGGLYGPLRATGPLPGDPATVILKLYGLTPSGGLIVIDLQAADIKPGP